MTEAQHAAQYEAQRAAQHDAQHEAGAADTVLQTVPTAAVPSDGKPASDDSAVEMVTQESPRDAATSEEVAAAAITGGPLCI